MSNDCIICKQKVVFYVWGSSASMDREKLIHVLEKEYSNEIARRIIGTVTVCMTCCKEHNLLKNR